MQPNLTHDVILQLQGSYTHIPHDHLAYRYEVLKVIGKGSFGQVVKAYDHKEHHHVAVKMVRNEKRFHRQVRKYCHVFGNFLVVVQLIWRSL